LYLYSVRDPIPPVPIPLRRGDAEVALELNGVVHSVFDRAAYHARVDYARPPDPPLPPEDLEWARGVIARAE
jgi:hypothetical protein